MRLQRFQGCSLETLAVDLREIAGSNTDRFAAATPGELLPRLAKVSVPYDHDVASQGLDHFLAEADRSMETIAAAIGADVAYHEWYLVEDRASHNPNSLRSFGGIEGYRLAAKVEVLAGTPMKFETLGRDTYFDLQTALKGEGEAFLEQNGWWIQEVTGPHQYTCLDGQSGIMLHDIEPAVITHSL